MGDNIANAVTKCLEEGGFKEPESRNGYDLKDLQVGKDTITGDFYMIMGAYPENRQGVKLIRWTTGYKEDIEDPNGKPTISKVLKEVITFKLGDDEAGLTVFPDKKDEKPAPHSNLKQLETDLQNMFRNAWPTSDIGDYLRTTEYRLRKYAQIVSQ